MWACLQIRLSAHQASPHVVPVSTGSVHKKGPLRGKIRSLFLRERIRAQYGNLQDWGNKMYLLYQHIAEILTCFTISSISKLFVLILKGYLNKHFSSLFGGLGSLFLREGSPKLCGMLFIVFTPFFSQLSCPPQKAQCGNYWHIGTSLKAAGHGKGSKVLAENISQTHRFYYYMISLCI